MTNTPALLNIFSGPWGSDSAFFTIWNRFCQTLRHLAYIPDEEDRNCRLLGPLPHSPPCFLHCGDCFCLGPSTRRVDPRWPSASAHDGWACAALSKRNFLSLATKCCCAALQAQRYSRGIWSSESCLFPPEVKRHDVVENHSFWSALELGFSL